jgi:hypothetical protein
VLPLRPPPPKKKSVMKIFFYFPAFFYTHVKLSQTRMYASTHERRCIAKYVKSSKAHWAAYFEVRRSTRAYSAQFFVIISLMHVPECGRIARPEPFELILKGRQGRY